MAHGVRPEPGFIANLAWKGQGAQWRLPRTLIIAGLALLAFAVINKYCIEGGGFDLSLLKDQEIRTYAVVSAIVFGGYQLASAVFVDRISRVSSDVRRVMAMPPPRVRGNPDFRGSDFPTMPPESTAASRAFPSRQRADSEEAVMGDGGNTSDGEGSIDGDARRFPSHSHPPDDIGDDFQGLSSHFGRSSRKRQQQSRGGDGQGSLPRSASLSTGVLGDGARAAGVVRSPPIGVPVDGLSAGGPHFRSPSPTLRPYPTGGSWQQAGDALED